MKNTVTLVGVLAASATWTGIAAADPVVQGVVLGVERAFGFTTVTTTQESGDNSSSSTSTGFSLGGTRTSTAGAVYSTPRVGVDYVMDMGLSFGAAFGVGTTSLSSKIESNGVSVETDDAGSFTSLIFAPRVGYLVGFNQQFGIWPRLGFSYVSQTISLGDSDNELSQAYSAVTVEAPLLFTPNKTFGFVATPALDLGVGGSIEVNGEEGDADVSATEFGFTLGLFVAF